MAVPTITVISPATGPVGGGTMLQVMGGGFQLPPAPPVAGPAPAPSPSVEVLFGAGADARAGRVMVASDARLFVITPVSPNGYAAPAGAVDVTIRNIDQDGDLVGSETVTAVDGFTYALPNINAVPEYDLTRLVRALIHELRRQVLPDGIYLTVHTDYDNTPSDGLAAIAEIPAIVLSGPDLRESRFYSLNSPRTDSAPFGLPSEFAVLLRDAYTVDLVWDIVGVTDNQMQLLSLMSELVSFFMRNKVLAMDRDASDSSQGTVSYEIDWEPGGQPKTTGIPNNSNIRAFRGTFAIRGFDIDDAAPRDVVVRQVEDQLGTSSVVTPSAVLIGGPVDTEEPASNTADTATGVEQFGQE